jgi:hypothetical protein
LVGGGGVGVVGRGSKVKDGVTETVVEGEEAVRAKGV